MGRHQGSVLLPARVSYPVKATVAAFARAYEAANPDEKAELRFWMRKIVLPRKSDAMILLGPGEPRRRALKLAIGASWNFRFP
jgi:hypothetical protein